MQKIEQTVKLVVIGLLTAGCIYILLPFITSILWAAIMCFSTWPMYLWLEKKFNGRATLAASTMTLLIAVVVLIPFTIAGFRFVESFSVLAERISEYRSDGIPSPPEWVNKVPILGDFIKDYWTDLSENTDKAALTMREWLIKSQGWILHYGAALLKGVFHLTISVIIAFFFYRDGEQVVNRIMAGVHKIAGEQSQHLLSVVARTIYSVVYGVLGTALLQGIVAACGFYIAGVPFPLLLGLIIFFVSLIPGGPPLVWVPATVWLFFHDKVGWGIFLLLWGILVISAVDHVLRPYIISRSAKLPFALVLLGVLGGIFTFGFIGVFVGPTLLAVGYSLIQEFAKKGTEEPAKKQAECQ